MIAQLQAEGGYLASDEEKALLERAMWDDDGTRIVATVAQPARQARRRRRIQHPG